MIIRNWLRVAILFGGFGAGLLACAAQTEDGLPEAASAGANSAAGRAAASGGTPSTSAGNAGAGVLPSAGVSGSFLPPAGGASSASFSGGPSTGPGSPGASGAFNSGSVPGGAGAGTGSAGAAATIGGCPVAAGTIAELAIDNLEDGDNVIQKLGSRIGYWYTYNDMTTGATQVPGVPFTATAMGSTTSPLFGARTMGMGFTAYGAGMGLNFNSPATATKPCPYNATAYSGIKFMAKGNVKIRAMVKTVATTGVSGGGSCVSATTCDDHYGLTPDPTLTSAWTEYVITFGSATFAQEPWGTQVAFDKATVLGMQFQVAKDLPFDFWIDDVTFF